MNDRFKFRCFSKKTKKMYEVDSLHLDSENEWVWVHYYNPIYDKDLKIQIETPNAVIMQSTGLKDKNGKLIYEGDIVVSTSPRRLSDRPHEVKLYKTSYGHYGYLYIEAEREPLVIGNIYENPELLEDAECQK